MKSRPLSDATFSIGRSPVSGFLFSVFHFGPAVS